MRAPTAAPDKADTGPGGPCPSCGRRGGPHRFYTLTGIPTTDVRLFATRAAAVGCFRGELDLAFCQGCGFIWNAAFDPALVDYTRDYESSQAASPTFNRFHAALARDLIDRHDLRGKTVMEIGCGQGEFLKLICDLGGNTGIGFDPAFENAGGAHPRVTVVKDVYSDAHAGHHRADLVCCKMTLEHIPDCGGFARMLRRALAASGDAVVFVQVPDVTRVLQERAFWDLYYEHCSYFSPGSLGRLFRAAGFEILRLGRAYDGQYLVLEAKPAAATQPPPAPEEEPVEESARAVRAFAHRVSGERRRWAGWLRRQRRDGRRTVLWGGGSKAVAFLTTLAVGEEVAAVVDVNPRKRSTFIPGSGHAVVAPEDLRAIQPDAVVIMNPIYREEIGRALVDLGLRPATVVAVTDAPPAVDRARTPARATGTRRRPRATAP